MDKKDSSQSGSSQPPDAGSGVSRSKPFLNPATAPVPTKIAAAPPPSFNPAAAAGTSTPPPPPEPVPPTAPASPEKNSAAAAVVDARDKKTTAKDFYDRAFPVDSPRRKFGLLIVAGLVLIVLLLAKCAVSSAGNKISEITKARAEETKARTTGVLLVKSNRPEATVEAARIAGAGEPAAMPAKGTLGQGLAGLAPGKYTVTLHAENWPDAQGEVDVTAGQQTELTINFKSGSLHLDSVPTGATVKLGANVLGKTPLVIPLLPPGESALSLQYLTWPAVPYTAVITENQEATATVRLPHGRLVVDSVPAGATVVLEGKTYKQTPLFFDPLAAGPKKLILQAPDLPALEVSVTVVDGQEVKIRPILGAAFPTLDPAELLRGVWLPDNPGKITANALAGIYASKNGVVKNIHRERLYNSWLRKTFRYTGEVKSYDAASGRLEFAEQKSELARYRVVAQMKPEAKPATPVQKGSTVLLYGRLTAGEEPVWPFRVITLELSDAEFLPEDTP